MLDEDEIQTVSTALYQYQSTIDRLKFISRNLKDAVEWQGTYEDKYHKVRSALYEEYGIVEQLDRLIEDGMMYLESTPVSELVDNLKDDFGGFPVVVENNVMDPVSFYYPLKGSIKLIGVARLNRLATNMSMDAWLLLATSLSKSRQKVSLNMSRKTAQ